MRVMVTRPREDSISLQRALKQRGVEVLLEPLLTIKRLSDQEFDLNGVHALIFTSANGVRAFASACDNREIPVFTVGDATAAACGDEGFKRISSAAGDVGDLEALVRRSCEPRDGRLIHVAANVAAGKLVENLADSGFDMIRVPLYESKQATTLSDGGRTALQQGRVDAVLFFSPRTATTFVSLVTALGIESACRGTDAICLSPAVADRAGKVVWRRVAVASAPSQDALLEALNIPETGGD